MASEYIVSEEVQELWDNPIEFDEKMLSRELTKTGIQTLVGMGLFAIGFYYTYRRKVKEVEDNINTDTVEVFVDEDNNVVPLEEIENGIYSIDLDAVPHTSIIKDGELYVIDSDVPEEYSVDINDEGDEVISNYHEEEEKEPKKVRKVKRVKNKIIDDKEEPKKVNQENNQKIIRVKNVEKSIKSNKNKSIEVPREKTTSNVSPKSDKMLEIANKYLSADRRV